MPHVAASPSDCGTRGTDLVDSVFGLRVGPTLHAAGGAPLPLLRYIQRKLRTKEPSNVANIKSQIKRNKTNEKARLRNQAIRSAVRTEIRKFQAAVEAGDKAAAEKQLRVASRALDKSVSKGVFHRNTAANKKSGMASAFNKMD